MEKVFLKFSQNVQTQACIFIKREFLVQLFSCEFYEICKSNFLTEHLRATASGIISNNRFPFKNFVFIICLQKQNISHIFFTWNNFI